MVAPKGARQLIGIPRCEIGTIVAATGANYGWILAF
jgi:hypothetical protein